MDTSALVEAAISEALERPDVARDLRRLEDPDASRADLAIVAHEAQDEILAAAADELRRLEDADAQWRSVLGASLDAAPKTDEQIGQLFELRSQLAEVRQAKNTQTTAEGALSDRVESLRSAREITKARLIAADTIAQIDSEMARLDGASEAPRAKQGGDEGHRDDVAHQRAVIELSDLRRGIIETASTEAKILVNLSKVEQRVTARILAQSEPGSALSLSRAQLDTTERQALRALIERGVMPLWRSWLTQKADEDHHSRYRRDLGGATATGLAELPTPAHEIPTEARERLRMLIEDLPGGSIGISGPRGVGKSTLIRWLCRGNTASHPGLTVMVNASVRYAPLEFVLHLGEQLCRTALGPDVDRTLDRDLAGPVPAQRQGQPRLLLLALAVGGVALVAGAAQSIVLLNETHLVVGRRQALVVAALATIIASATSSMWWGSRTLGSAWLEAPARRIRQEIIGQARFRGLVAEARDIVPAAGGVAALMSLAAAVMVSTTPEWDWRSWTAIGLAGLAGAIVGRRALPGLELAAQACMVAVCALASAAVVGEDLGAAGGVGAGAVAVSMALIALRVFVLRWSADGVAAAIGAALAAMVGAYSLVVLAIGWLDRSPSAALAAAAGLAVVGATILGTALEMVEEEVTRKDELRAGPYSEHSAPLITERDWFVDHFPPVVDDNVEQARKQASQAVEITFSYLRRIRHQRSAEVAWGTKLGLAAASISAEVSASGKRLVSEPPMSLPEAVDGLRNTLAALAETVGGVVIGIDEVDKMDGGRDAESFLNEVKAMFGIPGCYFVISMSEDAVAAFERRGMPVRDVFDSAFDDILRVDHLTLDGSERLLSARTVGLSLPFKAFCHCLAGGLPRDTIRVARHLFDAARRSGAQELVELVGGVTSAELRAKRDGTVAALADLAAGVDVGPAVTWLAERTIDVDEVMLTERLQTLPVVGLPSSTSDQRAVDRLLREFAAYWYLGVTAVGFLANDRSTVDIEGAERSAGEDAFDQLARARQALAIDPRLAWARLNAFRVAWQLDPLDLP